MKASEIPRPGDVVRYKNGPALAEVKYSNPRMAIIRWLKSGTTERVDVWKLSHVPDAEVEEFITSEITPLREK